MATENERAPGIEDRWLSWRGPELPGYFATGGARRCGLRWAKLQKQIDKGETAFVSAIVGSEKEDARPAGKVRAKVRADVEAAGNDREFGRVKGLEWEDWTTA